MGPLDRVKQVHLSNSIDVTHTLSPCVIEIVYSTPTRLGTTLLDYCISWSVLPLFTTREKVSAGSVMSGDLLSRFFLETGSKFDSPSHANAIRGRLRCRMKQLEF